MTILHFEIWPWVLLLAALVTACGLAYIAFVAFCLLMATYMESVKLGFSWRDKLGWNKLVKKQVQR